MSDYDPDERDPKDVDPDSFEPELDDELHEEHPAPPHHNPDRLAHDDPETEEDTASGGPA